LWRDYYANPSDATAQGVVSEFNCLVRKALIALKEIGRLGVTHGDYHMGNIMVVSDLSSTTSRSDGGPEIKLIDFGAAEPLTDGVLVQLADLDRLFMDISISFRCFMALTERKLCDWLRLSNDFRAWFAKKSGPVVIVEPEDQTRAVFQRILSLAHVGAPDMYIASKLLCPWTLSLKFASEGAASSASPSGRDEKCVRLPERTATADQRILWDYLFDRDGLWSGYLLSPSNPALVVSKLNCLIAKLINFVVKDGKVLTDALSHLIVTNLDQ
jgi:hypothetical protein